MAAEHLWFLTGSSFNQHCMGLHRSEGERLQLFNLARPDLGDWRGGRDDAKVGSESPDWTRQQSPESARVGVGSDMGSNAARVQSSKLQRLVGAMYRAPGSDWLHDIVGTCLGT